MKPQDWFVLGVRLFGVWTLWSGASYVARWFDLRFVGTSWESDSPRATSYLIWAFAEFAVATYFLLGARHLAGICYRQEQEETSALPPAESPKPPGTGPINE